MFQDQEDMHTCAQLNNMFLNVIPFFVYLLDFFVQLLFVMFVAIVHEILSKLHNVSDTVKVSYIIEERFSYASLQKAAKYFPNFSITLRSMFFRTIPSHPPGQKYRSDDSNRGFLYPAASAGAPVGVPGSRRP